MWCLCRCAKVDTVLLCCGRKHFSTPKPYCTFTSHSPDAPVSTSGLLAGSGICILEIGEGSQVSSLLASGRFSCSRSSSPRHFMTHLWSLSHTEKGYFALDLCSICSYRFPAKVTISPKENKRCSESLVNFCMWDEWGIDVRNPAVVRWWPKWGGMTLAMNNLLLRIWAWAHCMTKSVSLSLQSREKLVSLRPVY